MPLTRNFLSLRRGNFSFCAVLSKTFFLACETRVKGPTCDLWKPKTSQYMIQREPLAAQSVHLHVRRKEERLAGGQGLAK